VAAASRRDDHHALCRRLLEGHRESALVVPVTVAVEVDYLLRARLGAAAGRAFLHDLDAGRYLPEPVGPEIVSRARAIDLRYADADLGFVDATVVAVAEHVGAGLILTLDHHDLRPASQGRFELAPTEDTL
jgi:predicted nucleic acid-binding protein